MPGEWSARLSMDFAGHPIVLTLVTALVAVLMLYPVGRVLTRVTERLTRRSFYLHDLVRQARRPLHLLLPLLAVQIILSSATAGLPVITGLRRLTSVLLIILVCWIGLRAVGAMERYITIRHPVHMADNLRARKIQTQTRVLTKALMTLILIIGVAGILMTFPTVRQFGTSLLASAGLAGLVAGIAARPVLANLIAGLQIAITQPIRLDDVVIIEGEWGRIEEITGTYVVVKIWDDRRLVVPLQWIIENPFQNWTRMTSSLIGTVFFWVDYSVPIEPLRVEAERLCEEVPHLWDGKVCVVQVTDCNERAMQVRVLGSSIDSGRNWDLRCHLRENLLKFVNAHYPGSLPKIRTAQAADEPQQGRVAVEESVLGSGG